MNRPCAVSRVTESEDLSLVLGFLRYLCFLFLFPGKRRPVASPLCLQELLQKTMCSSIFCPSKANTCGFVLSLCSHLNAKMCGDDCYILLTLNRLRISEPFLPRDCGAPL